MTRYNYLHVFAPRPTVGYTDQVRTGDLSRVRGPDGKIEKNSPKWQGGCVQRKLGFQWGNEQVVVYTVSTPAP